MEDISIVAEEAGCFVTVHALTVVREVVCCSPVRRHLYLPESYLVG